MTKNVKILLGAITGIALLALSFQLMQTSPAAKLFSRQVQQQQIFRIADDHFRAAEFFQSDYRREATFRVNDQLFEILQRNHKYIADSVKSRIGMWNVDYYLDQPDSPDHNALLVEYWIDASGNLQGFSLGKMAQAADSARRLTALQAEGIAREFLEKRWPVESAFPLKENSETESDGKQVRSLNFEDSWPELPATQTKLSVKIVDGKITEIRPNLSIDEDEFESNWRQTTDIAIAVIVGVLWVIASITFIVLFFRRLRREEFDPKKARTIAIFAFCSMFLMVGAAAWDEWAGVLIGGGFSGIFFGLYILIISGLTESLARESDVSKIRLSDQLMRGQWAIRELGESLLNSLWIAGVAVLIWVGILLISNGSELAAIHFDDEDFWVFAPFHTILARFFTNLNFGFFHGLTLLGTLSLLIRYRWANTRVSIILQVVTFTLLSLQFIAFAPVYFSLPLFIVMSIWWVFNNQHHDLLTMIIAMIIFAMSCDSLQLTFFGAEGVYYFHLYWLLPLSLLLLPAGYWLVSRGRSLAELGDYVPEYVHRLREKERQARELEIARGIQQQFLPQQRPNFSGLDIAGLCRPAMEVGGDYFDFVAHDDHKFTIIIGDVSGKGVSAAFYMTMTKGIIKTLARTSKSPAEILTGLNEVFFENSPRNIFISVLLGTIDLKANTLTFARAGHNPLLVFGPRQEQPKYLNPVGIAIGMDRGPIFAASITEQTIKVAPGDLFVFYTDGVSEAMNNLREEYGEERLSGLIHKLADLPSPDLLDSMCREIDTFAGNQPQHDDFTVVVVKVRNNSST